MTASLNAVRSFDLASMRDTQQVTSGSSRNVRTKRNGDSFSQVLHRTTDDQKSSLSNRSRESEKKDKKSAKKDDDVNTTNAATSDSKTPEEKSSLPITFLFGLPSEPIESFDTRQGSDSSLSQIGAKAVNSNQLLQAQLGALLRGAADANGNPMLMMAQSADIKNGAAPDGESSQGSDNLAAKAEGSQIVGIGENGNSVKGAAGFLSANTLAFAMRLGSGETLSASKAASSAGAVAPVVSDSIQTNSGATTAIAVQAASGSALEENAHQHDDSAQAQNVVDPSAVRSAEPFETTVAEENATPPAAQVPADPAAATSAEPVRNVRMQLVSDDNRRVDVRLIDRGGELHVSVKSADTALTQNLQDHLPDLTARLDKQQMQTEVWVPKAAEPSKADGGNTNGSLSDPNARSYSSNSEGRREGRQQRRPDWVDALESYS